MGQDDVEVLTLTLFITGRVSAINEEESEQAIL